MADVTARSDALDLREKAFTAVKPKDVAAVSETVGGAEYASQGRPLPVGDIDAELLHQSSGKNLSGSRRRKLEKAKDELVRI
jgi:hypothetical protein